MRDDWSVIECEKESFCGLSSNTDKQNIEEEYIMRVKVKRVFVVGSGSAIFCQPDTALRVICDTEAIRSRVNSRRER